MIKVALDAMGGDNAPGEIVKGAVDAVNTSSECFVYLVGQEEAVKAELAKYTYNEKQIEVVNATEVIETGEPPVMAIRRKKDSSIVKALNMVKKKEADAFVSAGSSGAILVGGQVIVGRLPGVERPPIGAIVPTDKGCVLIVDSGANVDARPAFLVQWAKMGSIYMEYCVGIKNPRVAIVNVGLEEEKGNQLVKETFPLLKACKDINFIGSIEAREIPRSGADVIVCDAFVGNVILKLYEGLAGTLISKIKGAFYSSFKSKIGALLVKGALKDTLKTMDASEYGGAPLIGLNRLVVKTHGSAKAKEVKNSILQCVTFSKSNINEKIIASLEDMPELTEENGCEKLLYNIEYVCLRKHIKDRQEWRINMEFQKLQRIIAEVLNISEDKITPESTFIDDLKADSLDVYQIITEIEDQFEIQIPDDAAENIVTVGDAVSQIQDALAK